MPKNIVRHYRNGLWRKVLVRDGRQIDKGPAFFKEYEASCFPDFRA